MNYKIIGDSDAPIVDITLSSGETIKVERGAMAFMQNVSLQAETNSKKSGFGGLVGAIARSAVSGESMFITKAIGQAEGARLGIAPAVPGKVIIQTRNVHSLADAVAKYIPTSNN